MNASVNCLLGYSFLGAEESGQASEAPGNLSWTGRACAKDFLVKTAYSFPVLCSFSAVSPGFEFLPGNSHSPLDGSCPLAGAPCVRAEV